MDYGMYNCPQYGDEEYTINLTISAGALATRNDGDRSVGGTEAEKFINVNGGDYAVFILDGEGNYIQRFEPGSVSLQKDGADGYKYVMNGAFKPESELSAIQLMVFANWQTFGGNYTTSEGLLKDRELTAIYADKSNFNFTYPAITGTETETMGKTSWIPTESSGIPMFGLSRVELLDREKVAGNPLIDLDNPIPMLRSLAKIEIVNKVPTDKNITIEKCVLAGGYNATGRFIPDGSTNSNWNDDQDTQVEYPSLPDNVTPNPDDLYFVKTEKTVDDKTYQCFVVYIPEMELPETGDTRPYLQIYIDGVEEPYRVELAEYDETMVEGTEYEALLRNHSYRYNITDVEGEDVTATLTLMIDTDNWDNDEDEYYYDDIAVEFSQGGTFQWEWKPTNRDPQNPEDSKNLVVQQSGASGAEASFTITKPERGTWTLSLYCDDYTPNHWFQIEIWDDEKEDYVLIDQRIDPENEHNFIADTYTGSIPAKGEEAKEVKIRISAKDLQYSPDVYKARLVMNVRTFDGRMAEVDLINGTMFGSDIDDSSKEYYYIIQYPTAEL